MLNNSTYLALASTAAIIPYFVRFHVIVTKKERVLVYIDTP